MKDIVERAEEWLTTWEKFGPWTLMRGLICELKAVRAENGRLQREVRFLQLSIHDEVGSLSVDEQRELDSLMGDA
jgi:hypothetical protein